MRSCYCPCYEVIKRGYGYGSTLALVDLPSFKTPLLANSRLCWLQSRSEHCERKNVLPLPGIEPQ